MEEQLIPYQAVAAIDGERILVFAPHADDEIFGCGGAMLCHVDAQKPVHVVVVTDGGHGVAEEERAGYVALRQEESRQAARVVGYGEPRFLGYPDRGLAYGEKLVRECRELIESLRCDLVYAPSLLEIHPDHRALAMAVTEAARRIGSGLRLAYYEVGVPLRPNVLLDIGGRIERKMAAMRCFASQNARQRYDLDIAALNRYRSYTLPADVTAAEAYVLTRAEDLAADPLGIYRSEHARQKELGLRLDAESAPLVSIVIRSMGRPTLDAALDSVALQTYPNIEVVLVDARGAGFPGRDGWCGGFPLRVAGTGAALPRARAANVGLRAAQGAYAMFLDDDDYFAPDHVAKLADALRAAAPARACHTGVQCVDARGVATADKYEQPFDADRLLVENYIPIHSVLFDAELARAEGCAFDESLDLFEDWDFWLQIARKTRFAWVPGVSAYYRAGGGDSDSGVHQGDIRDAHIPRIYGKWMPASGWERVWRAVRGFAERSEAEFRPHLQGQQAALREMDLALRERERVIQEHERLIATLQTQLGEKNRLSADLAARLDKDRDDFGRYAERQAANLANQIRRNGELAAGLAESRAQAAAAREAFMSQQGAMAAMTGRVAELEERDAALRRSTSWRLTAPVRGLSRLLRPASPPAAIPPAEMPSPAAIPPAETRSPTPPAPCPALRDYLACFRPCDGLTDEVRWAMRAQIDAMTFQPTIGVRFSLLGLSDAEFQRAFDAARYQLYPRWELWVVDAEHASPAQVAQVRAAAEQDVRIRCVAELRPGMPAALSLDEPIMQDYVYLLDAERAPPELAFYRLAFFLLGHNYAERVSATESDEDRYTFWMERHDRATRAKLRELESSGAECAPGPLISVLMPVFDVAEKWLCEALDSVLGQRHAQWELCAVDDASTQPHVRAVLEAYAARDARVRVEFGESNRGVAAATNQALRMARGEYVVLMDHDDLLDPLALHQVARAAADAPDMVYSDEAIVDQNNRRVLGLQFRPAFSLEYLRAHPYIVHLTGFRREFLLGLGGCDESLTISHDYDLILRAAERAETIVHIPSVLYRWRTHPSSLGHDKRDAVTAASLRLLEQHLERCGTPGKAEPAARFNYYRMRYRDVGAAPRVAIVIPTKNHGELVRQCIDSIRRTVREVDYGIVVIDHDSDDPASKEYFASLASEHTVLRYSGPFNFSTINNFAVRAIGDGYTHYLFCNNDIEATNAGWLERMLELGQQPGVGVVGAKLLYPGGASIQHAGVIVGMNGIAGHAGQFMNRDDNEGAEDAGYMGRLIVTHEQMAVTAACMLVRKDAFDRVGGYDEALAVGFGDTDLCLRILFDGYRVLFCAEAELLHHESYTRGKSMTDPHPKDSALFKEKWGKVLAAGDVYYNPNFSINSSHWAIADSPAAGMNAGRRVWRRDARLPAGGAITTTERV